MLVGFDPRISVGNGGSVSVSGSIETAGLESVGDIEQADTSAIKMKLDKRMIE